MLTLALARPAAALLPSLAAALAPLCGHCSVIPWEATTVLVSALAGPGCPPWDAPEAAGCALPPGVALALAHLPAVVWVQAYTPPRVRNVEGREALLTTDQYNWGGIAREFGACGGGAGCSLAADVPFSQLGSVVLGSAGEQGAAGSAGSCTEACASPACGQGFGTCGNDESLVETAGLTGAGQLVQVVDTGLDTGLPFFYDAANPTVPRRRQMAPPAVASPHRKIADYWAFADGIDGDGHGTHCAGSVGGNAVPAIAAAGATATAEDKSVLPLLSGLAPMARLAVADIGCAPIFGYSNSNCTTIQPIGRECTPGLCAPPYSTLFDAAYLLGARISSNSWGPSSGGFYTQVSVDIDTYAYAHPDALLVWAGDNQGGKGSQTIGDDAASKNVLSVGATLDGLPAHLLKVQGGTDVDGKAIPALLQPNSPFGCGGVLSTFSMSGLTCPALPLTAASCAAAAESILDLGDEVPTVPGGYSAGDILNNYGMLGNLEFVLCCGCTPLQVMQGLEPTDRNLYASALFSRIYYSRLAGPFSSRGPTVDGRIKPDVAAPGVQVVSAKSQGGSSTTEDFLDHSYGNFSCGPMPYTFTVPSSATTFDVSSYNSPFFVALSTTEPLYIDSLSVPFTSPTGLGYADLYIRSVATFPEQDIVAPRRAFLGGATSGSLTWVINHTFAAGQFLPLYIDWTGAPEAQIFTFSSVSLPCFGYASPIGSGNGNFGSFSLRARRGGGAAYAIDKTGTSMATPIVAGTAALARQYFTGGFYSIKSGGASVPAPAPTTAGFSPSSALLKATLVNSASPLLYNDICQLPGQDYTFCTQSEFPRAQVQFLGGHGVPSLPRGLALSSLGPATRASGALASIVIPGLTQAPAPPPPAGTLLDPTLTTPLFAGVDPSLANGGAAVYCIDTQAPSPVISPVPTLPLSATLVWTDPPGSPLALIALVNNLDLELTPPGGTAAATCFGNNNISVTPQIPDTINNVEKLYVPAPTYTLSATGARLAPPYTVVVRGTRVPMGPQAYSLVVTGPGVALAPAGTAGCGADPGAPPSGPAAAAASTAASSAKVIGLEAGVAVLAVALAALGLYVAALKGLLPCLREGAKGVSFAASGGSLPTHYNALGVRE